jgi:hypothetical protein
MTRSCSSRFTCAIAALAVALTFCLHVSVLRADDSPILKGWQKAEWGSTPEQVTAVMPGVQPVKEAGVASIRGDTLLPKLRLMRSPAFPTR